MSVNSDAPNAQYFECMPNINMCQLCDCEVSDGRRKGLEHIQGKVHHKRKARAEKEVAQTREEGKPREEGARKDTMTGWIRTHNARASRLSTPIRRCLTKGRKFCSLRDKYTPPLKLKRIGVNKGCRGGGGRRFLRTHCLLDCAGSSTLLDLLRIKFGALGAGGFAGGGGGGGGTFSRLCTF